MKKIISILTTLIMCLTLSSCITTAQAQIDEVYNDDNVVVTYGIPYYNTKGLLLYYRYNSMYYYPYYHNHRYYLHRYSKPLPPSMTRKYRPIPRNFYRHNQPHRHHITTPNRWMRNRHFGSFR